MDQIALMVVLSLCSSAVSDEVRLVAGSSRCGGRLEKKDLGDWKPVKDEKLNWNLTSAAEVCRQLHCGSVVSLRRDVALNVEILCSEFIRLVNGTGLCSGRLEVRSDQFTQSWSSVTEDGFDLQDAEVVCRELDCGPPSVLQGGLFGETEAPTSSRAFQCEGDKAALFNCRSSVRESSGRAVGLICSEPDRMRLVRGRHRCAGTLEIKYQGEWKLVFGGYWTLAVGDVVCKQLDCGSAALSTKGKITSVTEMWDVIYNDGSSLADCVKRIAHSDHPTDLTCSESVRLINGTNPCSGSLEVKLNQSWSSVCENDLDLQDAEVVCREIGCGSPSVQQGVLYGEGETPVWSRVFHCGGSESALLHCGGSWSRQMAHCSPGKYARLTCSDSDDVRLVEGATGCSGNLEIKQYGLWTPVFVSQDFDWAVEKPDVICQKLDCGSAVSRKIRLQHVGENVPLLMISCLNNQHYLNCVKISGRGVAWKVEMTCSNSVRLVNGTNRCSGNMEVKTNQSWSSVCETDFDLQDAEVVCKEIGCGPPLVLQGAVYGEADSPVWRREFLCEGSESALLDCRSSNSSVKNSCSPGQAVELTCSEPIRLVGEASRCAGTLEILNRGQWRAVADYDDGWNKKIVAGVCAQLDCGAAVLIRKSNESSSRPVWWIRSSCLRSAVAIRDCLTDENHSSDVRLELICSDFLGELHIFLSSSSGGVSPARKQSEVTLGSDFGIMCSIRSQYEGGSFQLIFNTSNSAQNYTLPAANHSALFLFFDADHAHQGTYTCLYHIHVFSHNFSSMSQQLSLTVTVSASLTAFIIRLVVILLGMMGSVLAFYFKARRSQKSGP